MKQRRKNLVINKYLPTAQDLWAKLLVSRFLRVSQARFPAGGQGRSGSTRPRLIPILVLIPLLLFPSGLQAFATTSSHSNPIQHVVVIMQENHTFDNYF